MQTIFYLDKSKREHLNFYLSTSKMKSTDGSFTE